VVNNVAVFLPLKISAIAGKTDKAFTYEWQRYKDINPDYQKIGNDYFDLINGDDLRDKLVLDCGCGMGRWAKFFVENFNPQQLYCIDLSKAVFIAAEHLKNHENAFCFQCDIFRLPFKDKYFDFIYSLGVLHHLSDVKEAFSILSRKQKKSFV